jgi:oligopeptide/dipeptide ABC transporter ATP-binding protein
MSETILEVKNLVKWFPIVERGVILGKQIGVVHAVDDVNFAIRKGETFGLVGESGCGKTTTARCVLNLIDSTSGEVLFEGQNIFQIFRSRDKEKILDLRRKMQLVFQNVQASLNPRMKVSDILLEPFIIHDISRSEANKKVFELLHLVGLEAYHERRYPHQFSGGQRQRVAIARALALQPKFLVADEPVAMLDVSIRAQILNLLKDLQMKFGLSMLYISHDLSSVKHICDRVAIMYLGQIVEIAPADELFNNPKNPYTQALLSAIPIPDPSAVRRRIILQGEVPSAINPPRGCRFHPRCPYKKMVCESEEPEPRYVDDHHLVVCHIVE